MVLKWWWATDLEDLDEDGDLGVAVVEDAHIAQEFGSRLDRVHLPHLVVVPALEHDRELRSSTHDTRHDTRHDEEMPRVREREDVSRRKRGGARVGASFGGGGGWAGSGAARALR